jgi:hypothetical protein
MKTMYTKEPDEGCYSIGGGYFARPVHNNHQAKLSKRGWTYAKPETTTQTKEAPQGKLSVAEQAEALGLPVVDEEGNKIHHKTLKKMIEEASNDD